MTRRSDGFPRMDGHPGRRVDRESFAPPGGASASGLMRQSGIGAFDQGAPVPGPRTWGTPLDPTSGQIPGWEPGEAWPPQYTEGDQYIPDTNSPGEYISGDSDVSVGVGVRPAAGTQPGLEPLHQFPGSGEGLYSVQPSPAPEQLQSDQRVSNFGPVGDFINQHQETAT